jgi:twitching motility protein PilU
VTAGFPPAIKVDGRIVPQSNQSLTPQHTAELARAIMNDRQAAEFESTKECNFAISPAGIGRFRVNAFVQQGKIGCVLRTINAKIPTLDELGLPPVLKDVAMAKRGLTIFVGGTAPARRLRSPRWSTGATPTATVTSSRSRIRSSTCTTTRTAW